MKSALKRVASLLMALIMILEVVTPGVVQARSNNDNRASVSEEEFVPGDAYVPSAQNQPRRQAPSSYRPQRQAPNTYQPSRPAPSAPGRAETSNDVFDPAANKVEVSGEKAPKPLIQDEGEIREMALEFSREKEQAMAKSPQGGIENKKFTVITRFDTSMQNGPIQPGQFFVIHLDDKLKVNNPAELKQITYNGKAYTDKPEYNEDKNTLTYKITEEIKENIQIPILVDVDYNTDKLPGGEQSYTIVNSVSGLGVVNPKKLLPVVVDSNGNMISTIIEPGRKDVVQVFDYGDDYKVSVDAFGDPVIRDGEIEGIRWNVRVSSTKDLKELGFKANFTTVKGSGLGIFEDIQMNGKAPVDGEITPNPIINNLGIVDSKHHKLKENATDLFYSFYTPVKNKQSAYMLDLSAVLTAKGKKGAVRLVLPQGYSQAAIREATPTRVGMNNRTTIMGEFANADQAKWTITDAVCTGDEGNNGLPLESRKLEGDAQTVSSKRAASYQLNSDGKMVVAPNGEHDITAEALPAKETDPSGKQDVGTIAVYEVTTNLTNPDQGKKYSVSGVTISKCQDIYVEQTWTLPAGVKMPLQKFDVKDAQGNLLGAYSIKEKGSDGVYKRNVTIPGVKYWDIVSDGTETKATRLEHKIVQQFTSSPETIGDKIYTYYETLNYYKADKKVHFIHNGGTEKINEIPATIMVLKVDKDVSTKTLPGAHYTLQGTNNTELEKIEAITDADGRATFANIRPGTYDLIESKAPRGYKLDQGPQGTKHITISDDGMVTVKGDNVVLSGSKTTPQINKHDRAPNWPDYMNTMHYGKINDNGEAEFYLYLKPESDGNGGGTNRDTRLNISIPGVDIKDVEAYDVSPNGGNYISRTSVLNAMKDQSASNLPGLGNTVIGTAHYQGKVIKGFENKEDDYTHKTGYQIFFPAERFAGDWGFLVKVKANVDTKNEVNLSYDWLTNEDTENQAKLSRVVPLTKANEQKDAILTISNEALQRHPVSVTKIDEKKSPLAGATFVIKDKDDNIIDSRRSDKEGNVNFDNLPAGKYVLEELKAPDGYLSKGVVFDVDVKDDGKVTYKARFKNGSGSPALGQDYIIEDEDVSTSTSAGKVTEVEQSLKIREEGSIGVKPGVWEAYSYESLDYNAKITVSNSLPGTRFVIAFDPRLDLKQYVKEIPSIKNKAGAVIADPYMDYQTNRLTYVFNKRSLGGVYTGTVNIAGIIPNKFSIKEDGNYTFNVEVTPVDGITAKYTSEAIPVDYAQYDQGHGSPVSQSYYFGDIYEKDGEPYVDAIAYYNPLGDGNLGSRTLNFSWTSTDYGGNANIANWLAEGYKPAFKLSSVNIYRTLPSVTTKDYDIKNQNFKKKVNANMPLSFGVRPEQDGYTYEEVYSRNIGTDTVRDSSNGFTLNYNKNEIQMNRAQFKSKIPLRITMPRITQQREGYVIKQTFKITDKNTWRDKWRVFYMGNGTALESAFAIRARTGMALGEQTKQEIPQYTVQHAKLINSKYLPGTFTIHKVDRLNQKGLAGAVFELTGPDDKVYRRTSDRDGNLTFDKIPPGKYSLVETTAPRGYNASDKTWQVAVANDGTVTIIERNVNGTAASQVGKEITLTVDNIPIGKQFRVFKKDAYGMPLKGATFKITSYSNENNSQTATSDEHGVVTFTNNLSDGVYILEETGAPSGYKKLSKKWVVVVDGDKVKIYNHKNDSEGKLSIFGETGTHWVDVKHRTDTSVTTGDNRINGYYDNSRDPYIMGTRIVAINRDQNYVIQRYVINPEGNSVGASTAQIHREKPDDRNMTWYDANDTKVEIKAFKLDKAVTGEVDDIRLGDYIEDYAKAEIKNKDLRPRQVDGRDEEPKRMEISLPATKVPIVVDIKVPYTDENGGVGTGMDYTVTKNDTKKTYWKSDYYERVSDIKSAEPTVSTGAGSDIIGSYLTEDALDVTNDLIRYGFKMKKVKEGDDPKPIEGAAFKLTGPDDKKDEYRTVTGKDGVIEFNNLAPGKYTLEETAPATGYEKTTKTWTITVNDDGSGHKKDGELITEDTTITNKQIGLELDLFKKNLQSAPLGNAKFTLNKYKSNAYKDEEKDTTFGDLKLVSRENDGKLVKENNPKDPLRLETGYYQLTEDDAPTGYKKITAKWKIEVKEENGRLVADYQGPEKTPSDYLDDENLTKATITPEGQSQGITSYSRVIAIDPEAKTFVQRIYVDTRNFNGGAGNPENIVNVQINPVIKRDETDHVPKEVTDPETGEKKVVVEPPTTNTQGVKTAYRTTYKINKGNPDPNDVLKSYDLSKDGVSMVNTARWRPFDWGFDEDQLNLERGVYFIDVEGYYDDNIVKEGSIDIKFDFFDGKREFLQADGYANGQPTFNKKAEPSDSYQAGNANIAKARADGESWKKQLSPEGKYENWLGKTGGKITPSIDTIPAVSQTTAININPLYTSDKPQRISQDGLILENDRQGYNITFSKHGRKEAGWDITGKEVTNNRLEGAIFKLQVQVGDGFEDMKGTYVSSAFNGYFGFRNLKPGRYRLMEVKAPEGYTAIKDPILYFTVAYRQEDAKVTDADGTSKIIPAGGYISLEYNKNANGVYQYVTANNEVAKNGGAPLVDFVTAGTAKNMGKIVNEMPGKGKVTITKKDEKGKLLGNLEAGAQFKLTRLSAKKAGEGEKQDGVYYGTVGKDGKLVFDKLIIGNYRLEEVDRHPGHINNGQVWYFTIGGEKGLDGKVLDPYANEDLSKYKGKDRTGDLTMDTSMAVLRPQGDDDSTGKTVRPHYGAGLEFSNQFKLPEGKDPIKPGDYFVLKLSDNIDLKGTDPGNVGQLDIIGDGVGTIAKATYNAAAGTIKYTFTGFAEKYTMNEFTNRLAAFINLYKVKNSGDQNVSLSLASGTNTSTVYNDKINVDYKIVLGESPYNYTLYDDYRNAYTYHDHLNMSSKIVEFNQSTGEFTQYFYLNPKKETMRAFTFTYTANTDVENLTAQPYLLSYNGTYNNIDYLKRDMPESFGVDIKGSQGNIQKWGNAKTVNPGRTVQFDFSTMDGSQSAFIKVTGKVKGWDSVKKDLQSYETKATLWQYNSFAGKTATVHRQDRVFVFDNKSTAKAELEIKAVNPTNRISVKKVDSKGNDLPGAEFTLFKKDINSDSFDATGKSITTTNDNKCTATFDALESGEYQIRETHAPGGYVQLTEPAVEFKVDRKTGKILRKTDEKDKEGNVIFVEDDGTVPIQVVNKKPVVFKKVDANDEKKFLPGAVFEVLYKEKLGENESPRDIKGYKPYNKADGKPLTVTADENGEIELKITKPGYYALKEIKAPKDYIRPFGYVKEFVLSDQGLYTKEEGFEGNVKKQQESNDKDTSMMFIEKAETGGTFNSYLVINPAHEPRTYSGDYGITCTFDKNAFAELPSEMPLKIHRVNENGKKTTVEGIGVPIKDGKISLKFSDLPTTLGKLASTDTLIIESAFTGLKEGVGIVNLGFDITDKDGTHRSLYHVDTTKLESNVNYYPIKTEGQSAEDYEKALATYLETNRTKSLILKQDESKQNLFIENHKGTYPFTGGFGPNRWIVIIGALIAAIAAEEYIRRKRSAAEPKGGA